MLEIEFQKLVKFKVQPHDPFFWDQLANAIDQSSFTLLAWAGAWDYLGNWLDQQNLLLSHDQRLNYLICASEGAGNASGLGTTVLPDEIFINATAEYLNREGVDAATKK